jgi:hypothetical protein
MILNFRPESRGTVHLFSEDTTFKDLVAKDYFRNTQLKFPKDFNPETTLGKFLLHEETPLSIELRS